MIDAMGFSVKIIRQEDQKTASWSGGATTQMAIYPEGASYEQRNFSWRISRAAIHAEESVFTSLPGYRRLLMATQGKFVLEHEQRHTAVLKPFDQDRFDGAWTTRCRGKGSDLNVMLGSGYSAEMRPVLIRDSYAEDVQCSALDEDSVSYECIHPVDGDVEFSSGDDLSVVLRRGDLLIYKLNGRPEKPPVFRYVKVGAPVHVVRICIRQEASGSK
ncbi:HutD/Ves family protein [Paenibacillus ehimensis]|uniref:HutD family protein n=1 Tax=Paenibacillus ehimensis TaxID=79264 RepID=A0ABT8V2Z0_9BACL|nr:HutD family protein [Paenibacillus ehimensis]MDO3675793.1 HutD family protein [Paenibacillus ehimensis]